MSGTSAVQFVKGLTFTACDGHTYRLGSWVIIRLFSPTNQIVRRVCGWTYNDNGDTILVLDDGDGFGVATHPDFVVERNVMEMFDL